ncbi:MAG: immunoglobulin-like domain-containing protein, partial [Anaerovoracaceae bacterium]
MFFYEKKGKRLIAAVLAAVVAVSVFFMPGIGYETYAGEAEKSEDMQVLENVLKSYEYGVLQPEYGKDSNITAFLEAGIESKGYEGVGVKVKSSTIPENINLNGDITYFHKDINENQITASNKYVQPELVFELTKGTESVELTKKANIYWDIEKLKADLKKYILDNVTEDMIKGSNQDLAHVASDMELPAKLEGKSYANLLWETSDSNVLEIKNEGYAWEPKYKAVVKQSAEDKTVTLTLKTSYNFTNTDKENEEIAKQKKDFEVTVKGTGTDASAEMQKQLDDNYTSDKFKDSASGGTVNLLNVTGDITFPTLSKAGVGNSGNYKLTITSEDENIIKINGYKGNVYRPLPGEPSKTVKVTATMAERNGSLKVQKQFDVTVAPLNQSEIDAEIALMEKVKAAYFEGIRGENTDSSNITKNLHAFMEVSLAEDGETLQWVYARKDCNNKGIKPVDIEGYDPMGGNSWRTFRSSRSDIIKDENLLVIQPQYNTEVTIDSELSSIEYERYAEKYKDNEDFKKLSHQKVSATVKVIGTDGEKEEESKVLNKAKVRISLYDGRNKYFVVPFQNIEVSAGLAKSYGYTNANIEKHVSNNEVTMFDALVAVHAAVLGISSPEEEGAKESLKDMLTISSSGFLGKVMGEDTNEAPLSLMLNGRMPNDGIYNEAFGSYTGYTVEDSVIKDNDVLSFFFYQDPAYGDYYTWFEKDGKEVQSIEIPAEEMCSLTLRGYLAMYYGMSTEEKISQMTTSLGGIQLAVCGEDGMLTDIQDAVTVEGNASVSFRSIGEYILSAKGNGTTPIVAPYLKIKVTEAAQDTEKRNTVKADADALTFNSIKGKNTDSDTVTENLLLTDVGASGKTKITWKSSDKNYLTDEGVVKRPLCEEGDKTVTLTATVSYGTVTETKEIS